MGAKMKRFLPLLLFLAVAPGSAWGAFEPVYAGARPIGMAGAFVAVADDAEASFLNPGGMPRVGRFALTSYYTRLFGMKELAQVAFSAVAPTGLGHFGLFFHGMGSPLYREGVLGLSCGRSIGRRLHAGLALRRLSLSIENYDGASAVAMDVGILLDLPYDLRFGAMAHAVGRFSESGPAAESPRIIQAGLSRTGDRLTVSFQLDRHPRHGYTTRVGQEFRVAEVVTVRAGLTTDPSLFYVGLGLAKGRVKADYALSSHALLGITHRFSLTMEFG